MSQALEILKELKARGYRITKIRTAMVRYFCNSARPLDYSDFEKKLYHLGLKANKTTVYRELEFLKKQELIKELRFNENKKRYELASTGHHHHTVCLKCDQVEHIILEKDLRSEERKIKNNNNFTVLEHTLEFYGICGQCRPRT